MCKPLFAFFHSQCIPQPSDYVAALAVYITLGLTSPQPCMFLSNEISTRMTDTAANLAKRAEGAINIANAPAQMAAVAAGLPYVTGYYVNSVFVQNFGIVSSELVRLEYIKIGFMFWLLCVTVMFLPATLGLLTYRIRKNSGISWFWVGLGANVVCATLFIGIPCILSIFATDAQWTSTYHSSWFGEVTFRSTILASIFAGALGVIAFPALERRLYPTPKTTKEKLAQTALVEVPRLCAAATSITLAIDAFSGTAWPEHFLSRISVYLAVSLTFSILFIAALLWMRRVSKTSGSAFLLPIFVGGGTVFYYLLVTSFVHGVYPLIPSNRGGKLPLSVSYLVTNQTDPLVGQKVTVAGIEYSGPYVVIDENKDYIYVSLRLFPNSKGDFPSTYRVKREDIKLQLNVRLNSDQRAQLQ